MREGKKETRERERNHGGHNGCPLCRVMGMEAPFPPLYRLLAKYFPVGWLLFAGIRFKRGLWGNFVFEPRGGRTKFFNRLKNCFSFSFCKGRGEGIIKRVDWCAEWRVVLLLVDAFLVDLFSSSSLSMESSLEIILKGILRIILKLWMISNDF